VRLVNRSNVSRTMLIVLIIIRGLGWSQEIQSQPQLFAPGTISTGDAESHLSFTPDGKTVYFIKSTPSFNYWTIVESHLRNGRWTTPVVAPFSGQYADADPFVTADNKQLWFISNRPERPGDAPKEDMDIWYMERTGKGWSEPHHPGTPINSPQDEWFPSISDKGTLAFGSDRPGGRGATDIYTGKLLNGDCANVQNAGDAINSPEDEFEPLIAPDESWMIFMASRKDGIGRSDLYVSRKINDQWTPAKPLSPPINSTGFEYSPRLSVDRKNFFFASNRTTVPHKGFARRLDYQQMMKILRGPGNGLLDIYYVDLERALAGADSSHAQPNFRK
jgi:hypothetical protein